MNKETREAAAKALADKWYRCKDLDGTIAWLSAVDAVAPLLEGPLQREVEELKAGWAQTRENYRLSLDTNNETVSGLQRENETLRQERNRAQADAMAEYWIDRDRLTAAEAQLAAAREALKGYDHGGNPADDAAAIGRVLAILSEGRPG